MKSFITLIAAAAFMASTAMGICENTNCTDKAKSEHKCSDCCKDKCKGEKKDNK